MPSDIGAQERQPRNAPPRWDARLRELIDAIFTFRDEPQIISGFWPQLWTMLETARHVVCWRAASIRDGPIAVRHEGATLPDDHSSRSCVLRIGPSECSGLRHVELSAAMPRQDVGARRTLVIPLILDREGTRCSTAPMTPWKGVSQFFTSRSRAAGRPHQR